jgi:hypothetical protein
MHSHCRPNSLICSRQVKDGLAGCQINGWNQDALKAGLPGPLQDSLAVRIVWFQVDMTMSIRERKQLLQSGDAQTIIQDGFNVILVSRFAVDTHDRLCSGKPDQHPTTVLKAELITIRGEQSGDF